MKNKENTLRYIPPALFPVAIVITVFLFYSHNSVRGSVVRVPLQRQQYCLGDCKYIPSGIESLTGNGKFNSKRYAR
jgi:hypothetical protein